MEQPSHEQYRAALSALLDGEESPLAVGTLMTHLSRCADCSAWLETATRVNTRVRTLPVLQPALGERVVNGVDVRLCACATGDPCLCGDCQCGPDCTCHPPNRSV